MSRAQRTDTEGEMLAISAVTLPYDPNTFLVLRGPYRGQDLIDAQISASRKLLDELSGSRMIVAVVCRTVTLYPWWAWWAATPARRLTPTWALERVRQ